VYFNDEDIFNNADERKNISESARTVLTVHEIQDLYDQYEENTMSETEPKVEQKVEEPMTAKDVVVEKAQDVISFAINNGVGPIETIEIFTAAISSICNIMYVLKAEKEKEQSCPKPE